MLIRNAEIGLGTYADLRIAEGVIAEIGKLGRVQDDAEIDAGGAALLPGLHDHHIHFLAYAASRESVPCGPPTVRSIHDLASRLRERAEAKPGSWIRGTGYHHSVAGNIDREWLDSIVLATPVRIQDRSGRLWILNSSALDLIGGGATVTQLETANGRPTGRLYDGDAWLRERIGQNLPPIGPASRFLASRGVTGFTDTTPGNGPAEFMLLHQAQQKGDLIQDVLMMGSGALDDIDGFPRFRVGARKIHLHETNLPDIADMSEIVRRSHAVGRPVAVHCVTLAELVFALGAFDEAGPMVGDRIEHAAIAPPDFLERFVELGLTVVTQPNFVAERGDAYLRDVEETEQPWLYRLRGFAEAGIALAAGTDAPFGDADPWKAMQAAVTRRTGSGESIGKDEALTPEQALGLFLGTSADPGGAPRGVAVGAVADLCLLDRPWNEARRDLSEVRVAATIGAGRLVWQA